MQGKTLEEKPIPHQPSPTGQVQSVVPSIPNNMESSSQVPPNTILVHPKPVNTSTQEMEKALEVMRETQIEITVLKDIKIMVFNDK